MRSPKKHQAEARTPLSAMPYAETQAACERLRTQFSSRHRMLAPKAVERLAHDWNGLSPSINSRTNTGVICAPPTWSVAVRGRAVAYHSGETLQEGHTHATVMIWKLLQVAESTLRRLNAPELHSAVYAGAWYVDGVKRTTVSQKGIAA